jgi:hypothetical protein
VHHGERGLEVSRSDRVAICALSVIDVTLFVVGLFVAPLRLALFVATAICTVITVVAWCSRPAETEPTSAAWLNVSYPPIVERLRQQWEAEQRMAPAERRAAFLRERGFPGRVTVLSVRPTGRDWLGDPILDLDLVVHDQRWEPYRVTRREMVPRECVSRVARSASFFALIHPEARASLLIEWDVRAIA